jgi:rRNA maturation endonuclease Nob1
MRTLVQPPPSSHCDLCGGELRLKKIESADQTFDLEKEIFVCANCGHELSCTVPDNHTTPHTKVAALDDHVPRIPPSDHPSITRT